jgi:hypothetical protein
VALAAAKGARPTAQRASQFGIHTSQVAAWTKQLMAQVAELFADGRQRRVDQATDEQEWYKRLEKSTFETVPSRADEGRVRIDRRLRRGHDEGSHAAERSRRVPRDAA